MSQPAAKISKEFKFEAAHMLPNHEGKCRNLHGHSYKAVVSVRGPLQLTGSSEGMVVDFGVLSAVWKKYCEPMLDHQYLNETLVDPEALDPTAIPITTAEWIAWWIAVQFYKCIGHQLYEVTVHETATSSATVSEKEIFNGGTDPVLFTTGRSDREIIIG